MKAQAIRRAARGCVITLAAALSLCASPSTGAAPRTVCTITVNSADEKEAMRRHLPAGDYRFVELVEHGRPDWLSTACSQKVQCDVLVVSGHFNDNHFFSDRLESGENLAVTEMERAACSNSCPGLFSQLKEVYLFGCNSLNGDAVHRPPGEVERSLVRAGRSRAEAERIVQSLRERHGDSNRDVMRRVFMNTPAIYGFSSTAPVGPTAGMLLNRYFQNGPRGEIGSGRPNRGLLNAFVQNSMIVIGGMRDGDPGASTRAQACRFVDDRTTAADKLRFVHALLDRDLPEARLFFDRIERFVASVSDAERATPAFRAALDEIVADRDARERYLAMARDADQPSARARMTVVARELGWLSPDEYRAEVGSLVRDLFAQRSISTADVGLVCSLDADGGLDDVLPDAKAVASSTRLDHAAALACLGSDEDHAKMLAALTSANEDDVRLAEVYFLKRPIDDVAELRMVAAAVARMPASAAQVRALEVLARHHLSDEETLMELARLYPAAGSVTVQRALAGVLVRADYRVIASPELVRMLREHRLRSPDGADMVDILIRRVQASYASVNLGRGQDRF